MLTNKKRLCVLGVLLVLSKLAVADQCDSTTTIFEDSFSGEKLDLNKWQPMIGDGCDQGICGWGNNELQYYTQENATVADGVLRITAKKESIGGKAYTSARLRTAHMPLSGEFKHGRFEARIKVPGGKGMWSAFWMLPTDASEGWPMSGEIDIMEVTGAKKHDLLGTIHYGEASPNNKHKGTTIKHQGEGWSDDFHVYAVEWTPDKITWFVNERHYASITRDDLESREFWSFEDNEYHLLLNLAIGGNLGGMVDENSLPQEMLVDYVRVYRLCGSHSID